MSDAVNHERINTARKSGLDRNDNTGKRIVIATFGSLGDLHPYMAIAKGLQARGHRPLIATSGMYRAKVEAAGIPFHAVRPNFEGDANIKTLIRQGMDMKGGPEFIIREIFLRHFRDSYADLEAAARHSDLLVTHMLAFAGPLIAEKYGVRWVSTMLQPLGFFSAHDPPVIAPAQWLSAFRGLGPGFYRSMFHLAQKHSLNWTIPVREVRKEIGLPASAGHPLFGGQHSPELVLALFSRLLAEPQPDWPPHTRVTGFPFYDRLDDNTGSPEALNRFLDTGEPPIVFTLGSSAVMDAGEFYSISARVAMKLGRRAVLLIGNDPENLPKEPLPEEIAVFEYAPYSEVFPRAAAIVHQGGVGTTSQAMRAGKPMLIMPYGHDQPDNAARIVRLGCGKTISRQKYTVERVVPALRDLLEAPGYALRADEIGRKVREEDGVNAAADAIEEVLAAKSVSTANA